MNRINNKKKSKKKKTLHPFRNIFILLIIVVCAYLGYEYKKNGNLNNIIQAVSKIDFNRTKINTMEQSYSSNNSIDGQTIVYGQDGFTTTFTTLNSKYTKTYKEFKQNIDCSWNNKSYWGGTMSENGCGITSIAIIASGYGLSVTPEDLRKEYYPHLDGENVQSALKKMGFKCTDFYFHKSYLNKKYISDWLRTNRPIIICVGSKEENDWTNSSHYMDLLDINDNGLVYVSNPNGLDGEKRASRMV